MVTARNSGGAAASRLPGQRGGGGAGGRLRAPALRGSGAIGAAVEVDPGRWSGQPAPGLTLQWRAAGVAIPGATGAAFVPSPAEDGVDLDCLVTATNAAGSAALAAGPLRVTQAAPEAQGRDRRPGAAAGGGAGAGAGGRRLLRRGPELLGGGRRGGDRRRERDRQRADRRRSSTGSRWW